MASNRKEVDLEALTKLLRDPVVIRIVTILDIAELSILELFEYDLTRSDINHALVSGVLEIAKHSTHTRLSEEDLRIKGDIYINQYLNSKVRLTELGRYILDCLKGGQNDQELIERARERFQSGTFSPPDSPNRPF